MLTQRTAIEYAKKFIEDIKNVGYNPTQAYLFGSVAKSKQHKYSDVDLALWDDKFTGCLTVDYEPIVRILTKYTILELHTYNSSENELNNPFISEIKKTGIKIEF